MSLRPHSRRKFLGKFPQGRVNFYPQLENGGESFFKDGYIRDERLRAQEIREYRCLLEIDHKDFSSLTRGKQFCAEDIPVRLLVLLLGEMGPSFDPYVFTENINWSARAFCEELLALISNAHSTSDVTPESFYKSIEDQDIRALRLGRGVARSLLKANLLEVNVKEHFYSEEDLPAQSKARQGYVRSRNEISFLIESSRLIPPPSMSSSQEILLAPSGLKPYQIRIHYNDGREKVVSLESAHGYSEEFLEMFSTFLKDGLTPQDAKEVAKALL